MKKQILSIIMLSLLLNILTACDNSQETLISYIKENLQVNKEVEYEEPMVQLTNTYTFSIPISEEAKDEVIKNNISFQDMFSVYVDDTLTKALNVQISTTSSEIKISPSEDISESFKEINTTMKDASWGFYNHYHLIQRYNLETGEKYQKPKATIFTIEHHLETPKVSVDFLDDGSFHLQWEAIAGATKYQIVRLDFINNKKVKPILISSTTDTTWNSKTDGKEMENPKKEIFKSYITSKDEQYASDIEFWWKEDSMTFSGSMIGVIAKKGDDSSAISAIHTIPKPEELVCQSATFAKNELGLSNEIDSIEDLPTKIPVTTCDGNTVYIPPKYDVEKINISGEILEVPYTLDSSIRDSFFIQSFDKNTYKEQVSKLNENSKSVNAEPYIYQSNKTVAFDIRSSDTMPEIKDTLYGQSEIEKFVEANMVDGANRIDISSFDDTINLRDSDYIYDLIEQCRNQNPLILEIKNYSYDYNAIFIEYVHNDTTRKQLQQMVRDNVKSIISEIITPKMNDIEKVYAINQYICDNTEYDQEGANIKEYNHASTVASVFQDKKAICEGYAAAFMTLCDEAGLQSIMVTGYATTNLDVRHAWNRVLIDGQWYVVDTTGNDLDYTPNAYLLLADDVADSLFEEDTYFLLDDKLDSYKADGESKYEYYRYNGFYTSVEQAPTIFVTQLQNKKQYTLRVPEMTSESEIKSIANTVSNRIYKSFTYHWFQGVMTITIQ